MGQVQEQLHVEQGVSPSQNKVHHLPIGDDSLRRKREFGNRSFRRYVTDDCEEVFFWETLRSSFSRDMLTSADYVTQQKFVAKQNPNATVHNNNYVGIASCSYSNFVPPHDHRLI